MKTKTVKTTNASQVGAEEQQLMNGVVGSSNDDSNNTNNIMNKKLEIALLVSAAGLAALGVGFAVVAMSKAMEAYMTPKHHLRMAYTVIYSKKGKNE